MGNQSTKESRGNGDRRSQGGLLVAESGSHNDRPTSSRRRESRQNISNIFGLGSGGGDSRHDQPHERRETRAEREARRIEKERVARLKERERSMREEHVDGGYLVTLGTYQGTEDFNKPIVRQLQIERKLAPFWRGLDDISSEWTEPQIIAAARGLPIPPADQTPPDELVPKPFAPESPDRSNQNINNLMVPMGGRTQSVASTSSQPGTGKARSKVLAVLGGTSRNASTTEIIPREINLPSDPFINGQPLEVFLYKNASECPICFLDYPPYLNHTRCCDQAICSECFVQIKRPDPHFPEGHNENDPNRNPEEAAGLLVSEPATCPFCQMPEFGVTYEPPPFRRGLAYTVPPSAVGTTNAAMSSHSSLSSATFSPTLASPASGTTRRRAQSLAASDPNVVTTDRIRPEWAAKLQAARSHQARRAAAATALHTAAFLMGPNTETRSFRTSRFGRRTTGSGSGTPSVAVTPAGNGENADSGAGTPPSAGPEPGPRSSSGLGNLLVGPTVSNDRRSRSRIEDLEEMMFHEAVRLSLAEDQDRKAKEEKQKKKEAKQQEKEARKAAKAAAKHGGPYGDGASGQNSASGSTLSLPGFGRKRGNSGASNLRVEASVANAIANTSPSSSPVDTNSKDKGKAVDRGLPTTPEGNETPATAEQSLTPDPTEPQASTESIASITSAPTSAPRPIPSPHQPIGPSHLRQMSSASSISSSLPDSQAGSYSNPSHLQDSRSSGLSLGSRSGPSDHVADNDNDPSTSTEPMFNFNSLAEVVGVSLEGENAGRRLSRIAAEKAAKEKGLSADEIGTSSSSPDTKADEANEARAEHAEHVENVGGGSNIAEQSVNTLKPPTDAKENKQLVADTAGLGDSNPVTPVLTITPGTSATEHNDQFKQLGFETTTTIERAHEAMQ